MLQSVVSSIHDWLYSKFGAEVTTVLDPVTTVVVETGWKLIARSNSKRVGLLVMNEGLWPIRIADREIAGTGLRGLSLPAQGGFISMDAEEDQYDVSSEWWAISLTTASFIRTREAVLR